MRRIGGTLLTVTSFLACPCHLIVTLPLLISGLSGTALGSFLSRNTGLVTTFAGIYFVVALALGVSPVQRETARQPGEDGLSHLHPCGCVRI